MINFEAFSAIAEAVNKYHKDLRTFENNLNVSIESNWMTAIMESSIRALSRAFHADKEFEGFCYNELTVVQVDKIEEFLQYLIYAWDCGDQCPDWIVYERSPALDPSVKYQCRCLEDAYEIIVDYVEHFRDDTTWRFE